MFDPRTLFVNTPQNSRLQDGSYCRIRPLTAGDRHLLVELFEHWSENSRRNRFLASKKQLTEEDLNFFTSADGFDHIAMVAVRLNVHGEDHRALGVARCIRLAQKPESAEMSVAVAEEVQRQGVGSVLLDRLTKAARHAGIHHFVCEALADNPGMRALAMQRGGSVCWHGDGTVEYEWPLLVDRPMDGLSWSLDPQKELSESVELWLTMIEQSVTIGYRFCHLLIRRIANPDPVHSHP